MDRYSSMTPRVAPARANAGPRKQGELHALLSHDLGTLDHALRRDVASLTAPQRRLGPSAGGWHVDAVCEHLCLTNEHYLRTMTAAVESALGRHATDAGIDLSHTPWRPSLGGRLLVHALVSPTRMPRPRALTPGPEARAQVLDALLATHHALRVLLQRAAPVEWRRVRFSSPFARLLRLNLGDGALAILRHGERHLGQIARIRAATLP